MKAVFKNPYDIILSYNYNTTIVLYDEKFKVEL